MITMCLTSNPLHAAYLTLISELKAVEPSEPVFIHEFDSHIDLSGLNHHISLRIDDKGFYLDVSAVRFFGSVRVLFPMYKRVRFSSFGIGKTGFIIQVLKEGS